MSKGVVGEPQSVIPTAWLLVVRDVNRFIRRGSFSWQNLTQHSASLGESHQAGPRLGHLLECGTHRALFMVALIVWP